MGLPRSPRWITFDVFGTLFRVEEIAHPDLMEEIIQRTGLTMGVEELGQRWWDASYRVAHESFVTVREATRRALGLLFEEVEAREDPGPFADRLLARWGTTNPYDEVPEVLRRLEGFRLGIVSNIDDELLETLLHRSGLAAAFALRVTSEASRAYKPEAKIFRDAVKAAECPPEEVLHLGDTPVDDVLGPKRVGMMAGWINRRGEAMRGRIPAPDLVAADLREAADLILRRAPGS